MSITVDGMREVLLAVAAGLRSGKTGKLAAAQSIEAVLPAKAEKLPVTNGIKMFYHCRKCLEQFETDPEARGKSRGEYARLEVGWTEQGLQVWCARHNLNVLHVHFEGLCHQSRTDAEGGDKGFRQSQGIAEGSGPFILEHPLRGVYMGMVVGKTRASVPSFSATKKRTEALSFESISAAQAEKEKLLRMGVDELNIFVRRGLI